VQALIEAAKRYEEQNAEALSNMENFDGLVEVVIPDGEYLSIDQLEEACTGSDAKRSTGKLKVVAFSENRQSFRAPSCIWKHTRRGGCRGCWSNRECCLAVLGSATGIRTHWYWRNLWQKI
jgi:hypothetical protein